MAPYTLTKYKANINPPKYRPLTKTVRTSTTDSPCIIAKVLKNVMKFANYLPCICCNGGSVPV